MVKHPIWRDRAVARAGARQGVLVGTGVACVTKDFGTGADCTLAKVALSAEGRITIHSDAVEMGTAVGTALANRVATVIGGVADEVSVANVEAYAPLALVTSGDPFSITQSEQDQGARNPRWVPAISSVSSASIGAHVSTHGAFEAARVIFRFGLWPAALELWGIADGDLRASQWERAQWRQRRLIMPGLPPLELAALAAKAHARRGVTETMVHGFNRWEWSRASFVGADQTWTADIDALAGAQRRRRLRAARSNKHPIPHRRSTNASAPATRRCAVRSPSSRSTATAAMCGSSKPTPRSNAGARWSRRSSSVRHRADLPMGVGYAFLELLPLYEGGPGDGTWNLGRYLIARGSDLPLHDLQIEVLPQLAATDTPKGIAEVVMIPIVPAILNAIHDATGYRFRTLPVTETMIKGALP